LPRDEEAGRTRLARSESRALRRKLVEGRRPRRDEYRYAQEVPGGTGTSEAGTALTSTFRTAGCGPACPVVWEGSSGITAAPYPDRFVDGCTSRVARKGGSHPMPRFAM